MTQAITNRAHLANGSIQRIGLGGKQLAIDFWRSAKRKHPRDLIQRKSGAAEPIPGEHAIGRAAHYLIGIAFARVHSLITHAVFGTGLYIGGVVLRCL